MAGTRRGRPFRPQLAGASTAAKEFLERGYEEAAQSRTLLATNEDRERIFGSENLLVGEQVSLPNVGDPARPEPTVPGKDGRHNRK